jgi:hypothetical protein
MDLNIRLARSDADIDACGSVMRELRPHVPEDRFPALVRDQERTGYRLAMASTTVGVVAVAGFRIDSPYFQSAAWRLTARSNTG